jgi:hypothetical protein
MKFAVIFVVIATIAALPRFGQRENEHQPTVSDSDLYLEMARVFTGDKAGFNPEWVAWQPHHYNRPLLPFVAGHLGKYLLGGNLRAAFSIVNILCAALVAMLLMRYLREHRPEWKLCWAPSVLFLTAFPQINWGYHIFTDTTGYGTAMALAMCGDACLKQSSPARLVGLLVVSVTAYLARETAWLAVFAVGAAGIARKDWPRLALVLAVMILGNVPHLVYASVFSVSGVPLTSTVAALLNWRYVVDFALKTGVCFNLSWIPALLWLRHRAAIPPLIVGWAIGAVLYMGAGYFANTFDVIGYPLRLSYALFPLVFFCVTEVFERWFTPDTRTLRMLQFCGLQFAVNMLGVFLDPGRPGIKATDLIRDSFRKR